MLGVMPWRDSGEDDLKVQIAWFTDIATLLKELIELGKKNSENRDLAFSEDFAAQFRYNFFLPFGRKLRKCKGEGQEKFENMLDKIEEFRGNALEDLNAFKTLDDDDITANSEINANDVDKVDVFKLSEQQVEKNLKGHDGFDDSKVYKAAAED